MNFKQIDFLQACLMQSHHRRGAEANRTFLEDIIKNQTRLQPDMTSVDPNDYWHQVGKTYVLANYIQKAYQKRLSAGQYLSHDASLVELLSTAQAKMKELADFTPSELDLPALNIYRAEQGELSEMIKSPQDYYVDVDRCQEVEPTLDSIHRFRLDQPVPFDQVNPETIHQLYSLYQSVATIDPQRQSKQEWQEKVEWLNWAAEQFTPLSQNEQMKKASLKSLTVMDQHARAFQHLVSDRQPNSLPEKAIKALKSADQAVDTQIRNIDFHFINQESFGKRIPLNTPDQNANHQHGIHLARTALGKPRQQTLFGAPPSPSKSDQNQTRPPIQKPPTLDRQID